MCGHKRDYDMRYEQARSYQSRKLWHMSWLPFAVIVFFAVVGFHSWESFFQPWMFWWLIWLLPGAFAMMSSSFKKESRNNLMFNTGTRTQELPRQVYEQPYQSGLQETYTEGGQNFHYPQQQVQQMQYEEPYADYR